MYKLKTIVGIDTFLCSSHYNTNNNGYIINILRKTPCLVVSPIMVDNFAFLFNCTPISGPQILCRVRLTDLSIDKRIGAWCRVMGQTLRGLTVGFILLRYSVGCTAESLSLLYLIFMS